MQNLCLKKAEISQVHTARLPIGTYLAELKTRKVLTVNQTFEILLKWVETRDWKAAFEEVIPKRKFNEKNKASRRTNTDCGSDRHEDDEEEELAEVDDASRQVIVDAIALESEVIREEMGDDEDTSSDVEVAGGETGALVAAPRDTEMINENGPAVAMDGAHPEVPRQPAQNS